MKAPASPRHASLRDPLALLRFLVHRPSVRLIAAMLLAVGLNIALRLVWSPWLLWGWPAILLTLMVVLAARRSRASWVPGYLLGAEIWVRLWLVADDAVSPMRVDYAVAADHLLRLGQLPTAWLQGWLYAAGEVGPFDVAMIAVYVTFFFGHQVALFALILLRPRMLGRYAVAFMATSYISLAVMFLVPTAPPWLASDLGAASDVARVAHEVLSVASGSAFDARYAAAQVNEVAAMPSMHLAATLVVSLAAVRANRGLRWLAIVYPVAMGLALVYLGEHYVVDVLAGAVVGYVGWRVSDALLRSGRVSPSDRGGRSWVARARTRPGRRNSFAQPPPDASLGNAALYFAAPRSGPRRE